MSIEQMFRSIGNKDGLVHRVVNEIQGLVLNGKLDEGTKLPPERDLAEQMGVSRTVIREAVSILAAKGLLETRHGIGTIVSRVTRDNVVEPLSILLQSMSITLDDLHQVRSIIEVEVAGLAAAQRGEHEVVRLKQIANEMKDHIGDAQSYARYDDEFHQRLAVMTGNPLLVVLSDALRDLMADVRLAASRQHQLVSTTLSDHLEILERVESMDIEGAREAMRSHIENARRIQELVLSKEKERKLYQE